MPRHVQRICVFMGSSPGRHPHYAAAARAFARRLVERGLGLVYGGARVDDDAERLLDRLPGWRSPTVETWLEHAAET